ncbi:hypothetical protein K438DRAFT_1802366 [Mycena galopus ATCC 62051]|nr:hypothetical protein K438DRAFT_1802366 [Mycena galopus ATCC 62051]
MIPEDGTDDDDSILIAVKMAIPRENANTEENDDEEREIIRKEGLVYEFLAKTGKQGIIPHYYGVFEDSVGTVALVLDNGGTALKTFKDYLDSAQKLFAKAVEMHSAGVRHHDLEQRNVVQDSDGDLRIIDFHIAEMGYRCRGRDKCKELSKLRDALGL